MDTTYETRRAEEKAREKAIKGKLIDIAKAMKFKAETGDGLRNTSLKLVKDDKVLHFYVQTYGAQAFKKVRVSGSYPRDCKGSMPLYGNEYAPEIGVSMDKTPDQIAKDIERRFMPSYITALELAKKKIKAVETEQNKRETTIKQISGILGLPYASEMPTKTSSGRDKANISQWNGENHLIESIKIDTDYHADTVRFEFECKTAVAFEVCQLLKKYVKK